MDVSACAVVIDHCPASEVTMTDSIWVGAVTLIVFAYLIYALLVPERF
jgi:K+-transporting ATPase KdpF subunit